MLEVSRRSPEIAGKVTSTVGGSASGGRTRSIARLGKGRRFDVGGADGDRLAGVKGAGGALRLIGPQAVPPAPQ